MTPECAQLNLAFKQSEQQLSDSLIKYKAKISNAYWGKVRSGGAFPKASGTEIKIVKLGRSLINPPRWQGVTDTLCNTNACANPEQELIHMGFEEDSYSLARTAFRTDWICIDSTVFREMAPTELANFEDNIRLSVRYCWEEFSRSRYIHFCQNKVVALMDDDDLTDGCCDTLKAKCTASNIDTDSFRWARYAKLDGSDGEINENYVFVKVNPTKIANIAELSLDMLDEALIDLESEDDNMPFIGEGIDLFDVVLAHPRMGNRFVQQEDRRMNNAMSYGGYDAAMLKRTLGTKGVFRDHYSVRYDAHSARFYPDEEYNNALVAQGGYAFDESDPETWPRFVRVYRYRPQASSVEGGGIIWVPNKENYQRAPFAISTIFSPNVIAQESYPEITGIGSAQKAGVGKSHTYAGNAVWHNPDWQCNEDRNKGFWKVHMGAAMRPIKPEFGYAYFHRIDHRIRLQANCCALPSKTCHAPVSPYCYDGVGSDEADLNGTFGQVRPMYNGGLTIN